MITDKEKKNMLKRCQDLFIRKIIVAFLFMVGFTAADILGQQNIAAKTQPSDEESAKKVDAFLSQWDKNDMPGCAVGVVNLSFTRDDKGKIAGFVFNSAFDERDVKGIIFKRRQ